MTIWLDPWTEHTVFCPQTGAQACARTAALPAREEPLLDRATAASAAPGSARARSRRPTAKPIIPYLNTDFIYSAIAQELGLVGAAALLLVFMLFVARGMRVALLADDGFSKLLAAGLTFGFALQTFIIVGGVLRVIPLTGITLPFVSYGGSSVVANFVLLAGLLLVSNRANAEHAEVGRERPDHRLARRRRSSLIVVARRRDDLLAGVGGRRASPTGRTTRSSASRSSRSSAGRSSAPTAAPSGDEREQKVGGRTLYFRRYPHGRPRRRTSSATRRRRAPAPGSSARCNDYLTGSNANLSTLLESTLDKLKGVDGRPGNDLVLTLNLQRAAGGARRRSRGAAAPSSRSTPRTGKVLVMAIVADATTRT